MKNGVVKTAIEIKNTLSPKLSKGMQISMEDTGRKKVLWYVGLKADFLFPKK